VAYRAAELLGTAPEQLAAELINTMLSSGSNVLRTGD
jgi:hypothetical protein